MRTYAFVDIETSGLDPRQHEVIEVGYLVTHGTRGDLILEREFSLPFDEGRADAGALSVNGWGRRKFAPVTTKTQGAQHLAEDLRDCIFVANNAQFDAGFLAAFLDRQRVKVPWNRRIVNLKDVACGVAGIAPPVNSSAIGEHFGVPEPEDKHTALADARWNRDLFAALGLWDY